MGGPITGLQPIGSGTITDLQPISSGAGGSFEDATKWTPGRGERAVSAVASPVLNAFGKPSLAPDEELTHTIAQSFDLANLGQNFMKGAVGVAKFAHGLGKDLVQNPNWVLGEHSVYDKYISDPASAEFTKAIEAGRAGQYSEAAGHGLAGALPLIGPFAAALGEQAGKGDVGGAVAQGVGAYMGGKALEMAAKAPSEAFQAAKDFSNRASSLDAISTNASAVHKVAINHIQTTIESLKAEGVRTIQDAIKADQDAAKASGQRGTISSTPIVTEGMRAMEDVGYQAVPKPVQAAISRVAAGPTNLTLEEAVKLRTAFGDAAAKAQGNPKAYYVLNAAREELNPGIEQRFGELGQAKAWNYYNKKFTSAYDIQSNYKSILDGSGNRYDSIGKMDEFSKMNLTELQREMKNQGMTQNAKQIETVKADAKRIVDAHDILSRKMGKSMFVLATSQPKLAALGIAAAVAVHPAVGIGGYLLGTMLSNSLRRVQASMDVGRLGKEYPGAMDTVGDSGPKQSFQFSAPSQSAPVKGGPTAAPAAPSTSTGSAAGASAAPADSFMAEAKAKLGPDASMTQIAREALRMKEMKKRGMPYQQSEISKADRIQRIKKYNKE